MPKPIPPEINMAKSHTEQDPQNFLSTRQVAKRLSVAVSTVQSWVETGVLPAWKTAGGHRRIPADAVEQMARQQQKSIPSVEAQGSYKILVVEDDPVQCELYRRHFEQWQLPVQLFYAEDGFEGLVLIGRHDPQLIIADLAMPGMDGFKMIRKINSLSQNAHPNIIVVTALSQGEIEAAGGLPASIPVYPKPIPFAALQPMIRFLASTHSPAHEQAA